MALTLSDIRTEVRANLKDSKISSSRIDFWANAAQDSIWRQLDPEFGKETTSLTTTSGTRTYFAEVSSNKVLSVVDQTNDLRLVQISETELERYDPDLDDSGSPTFYSLYGIAYINAQPSSASVITVSSSSTSDTTQTVQIIGTSGGVEVSETHQ